MTLSRIPSGRWRARIWSGGKDVSVAKVLGIPEQTWATKREARDAYDKARAQLRGSRGAESTLKAFWDRWTTDAMFARTKDSTNAHNRERTKAFVERYGSLELRRIGKAQTGEWLMGGARLGTVPALRTMFNDAIRLELCDRNPFAGLGIAKTRGNKDVKPPSQDVVWELIRAAHKQGPSFAEWLQVAAFTGMRPGELDALRWDKVDFERSRIHVDEQWSAHGRFTLPKNGQRREAPLTAPARDALLSLPRESEFCFVNLRGEHWTPGARAYWWKATKAAVGYEGTLYTTTRHHAGWYMRNVLNLTPEDIAIALGHTDGGYLARTLYGHPDTDLALDRVVAAYGKSNVRPLHAVREDEAG